MLRNEMSHRPYAGNSSNSDNLNTETFIERLLEGGLLNKIEDVVERTFNKRINQLTAESKFENNRGKSKEAFNSIFERLDNDGNSYNQRGSEFVDPFEVGKNGNITIWLTNIDKLGDTYGWTEYERKNITQARLKGAAREWFYCFDNQDKSWSDWKQSLIVAFSNLKDYATMLEELLSRIKMPDETHANYFQEKLRLCSRCDITGDKAVSVILHGLPKQLQANGQELFCQTPQELYLQYFSKLDEYEAEYNDRMRQNEEMARIYENRPTPRQGFSDFECMKQHQVPISSTSAFDFFENPFPGAHTYEGNPFNDDRQMSQLNHMGQMRRSLDPNIDEYEAKNRRSSSSLERETRPNYPRSKSPVDRLEPSHGNKKKCFNCQEITNHLSRDCPKPKTKCGNCKRRGHLMVNCPDLKNRDFWRGKKK